MLRLADNPPILTPLAGSVSQLQGRWWVAHTKARFEKALAWDLLRRGIQYFLPLRQRVSFSGGRKRLGMAPLFTSYLFLCGGEKDRHAALTTGRICQTIDVADQKRLVRELEAIEKALAGRAPLDPYPFAVAGTRCRVKAGPFEGIEGVVIERTKAARLVLQVSAMGQAVVMEIDGDLLEPVE